jgi:hypothetical protein
MSTFSNVAARSAAKQAEEVVWRAWPLDLYIGIAGYIP